MALSDNTPQTPDSIMMDGHDEPDLISSHSLLLTSSLIMIGSRSSHYIADKSKTPQPVYTYNKFYSPSDIKMTLLPTAYTSLPVSSLSTPLDPKHHHPPPYVYDDCPDGWEFDDNIINNNTLNTDIALKDSQPSIFFDNDPPPPMLITFLPYPILL